MQTYHIQGNKLNDTITYNWLDHFSIAIMLILFQLYYIFPNIIADIMKIILPLITFVVICLRKSSHIVHNRLFLFWLYSFTYISLISLFYSVSISTSLDLILSLCSLILFLGVVSQYAWNEKNIERVINYLIVGGILYGIYVAVSMGNALFTSVIRPELAGGSRMQFTYVITPTLFYLIWRFLYRRNYRFIIGVSIVFMYIMSLATGSKKAFLFPLLFLLILLLLKYRRKIWALLLSALITPGIILVFYNIIMNNVALYNLLGIRIEGFINFFTGEGRVDGSTRTRVGLIEESWNVFLENPIFGVGLGGFQHINLWELYAHNNFMELLSGLGILGFVSFYWIYIYLIIKLIKLLGSKNEAIAHLILALLITNLIHDIGTVSYFRPHFVMFICLGTCYLYSYGRKLKSYYEE